MTSPFWAEVRESQRLDALLLRLQRAWRRKRHGLRAIDAISWLAVVLWNWAVPALVAWSLANATTRGQRVPAMVLALCAIFFPALVRGSLCVTITAFEALRMPSRKALVAARALRRLPWLVYVAGLGVATALAQQAPPVVVGMAAIAAFLAPFYGFAAGAKLDDGQSARAPRPLRALALASFLWLALLVIGFGFEPELLSLEPLPYLGGIGTLALLISIPWNAARRFEHCTTSPVYEDYDQETEATTSVASPTELPEQHTGRRSLAELDRLLDAARFAAELRRSPDVVSRFATRAIRLVPPAVNLVFGALPVANTDATPISFWWLACSVLLVDPIGQLPAEERWLRGIDLHEQEIAHLRSFARRALLPRVAVVLVTLAWFGFTEARVAIAAFLIAMAVLLAGWRGLARDGDAFGAGCTIGFMAVVMALASEGLGATAVLAIAAALGIVGAIGIARRVWRLTEPRLLPRFRDRFVRDFDEE